jgi:tetratricopeptide (TPR) repeat protein
VFQRLDDTPEGLATRGQVITEEQQTRLDEAKAAKQAGNYGSALSLFQEILAENPTIATAYVGIGDIHMIQDDYEQAEPAYRRAARLEPRNFDAQFGHGLALHMLAQFAEAIRAFHRALTIEPENVEANLSMATTYLEIDKPRSAILFAEKAVRLDPDNGPARANLGAIYEMEGRNREAIEQYLAAMELLPPSPPLILNLINVLAKERRYEEVVNTAENLLKIEPSADAYERLAYAHFRLGDFEASAEAYRQAVELDDRHWQSWNGIGVTALNAWLLSKKRDTDAAFEARGAFRQSLRINPRQPKVVALLSNYQL